MLKQNLSFLVLSLVVISSSPALWAEDKASGTGVSISSHPIPNQVLDSQVRDLQQTNQANLMVLRAEALKSELAALIHEATAREPEIHAQAELNLDTLASRWRSNLVEVQPRRTLTLTLGELPNP